MEVVCIVVIFGFDVDDGDDDFFWYVIKCLGVC